MPTYVTKEPVDWRDSDLPNLRRPVHRDGYGPLDICPLTWRCEHGVYFNPGDWLSQEWAFADPDTGEMDEWRSPWCDVCLCQFLVANAAKDYAKISRKLLRPRRLGSGEWPYRRGLFDKRPLYPETFTKGDVDTRLTVDYETSARKLETMGGYIAKVGGYGKAGKGHGPDMDADNIRMSWLASHEDGPSGGGEHTERRARLPWEATLPGWRKWLPYSWPIRRDPVAYDPRTGHTLPNDKPFTNPIIGLGLTEGEFFGDERSGWLTKKPEPAKSVDSVTDKPPLRKNSGYSWTELDNYQKRLSASAADNFQRYQHYKTMPLDRWWERFTPAPTERELAQWRRTMWKGKAPRVPLRRTPRWPDDWRTERPMRDLAAKLKMYKYGENGLVQTKKMCATANKLRWQAWTDYVWQCGAESPLLMTLGFVAAGDVISVHWTVRTGRERQLTAGIEKVCH